MKEAFEKVTDRLVKKIKPLHNANWNVAMEEAIEIVNQVAEEYNKEHNKEYNTDVPGRNVGGNDGWIPCSERLPTRNKYYDITYCTRTGMHTSQALFNTDDNSWYWEPGIMICTDKVLAWVDSIKRKPYQPKGE